MRPVGWIALILCTTALGCATAPTQHVFVKEFTHTEDYDKVWAALIETYSDLNLPIGHIEKASGLITTGWLDVPASYCDCGNPGLSIDGQRQGEFNVFVKQGPPVKVKVNATFRVYRTLGDYGGWVECPSTGEFETRMDSMIKERLAN
jgi:hypothetical protein